ncbi:MAG TPA: NUDIX hydrolase [Streptosporangiaceae bacterium]
MSEQEWFAQLPTLYAAAAALFTDQAGRVLLVKPNYRDHWSLPGGILEHGEPPHMGCAREVAEEIGLEITADRLLTVDWMPPDGNRPKPSVHFIFDGGTLDAERIDRIVLQEEELDDYRFTDDYASLVPPFITARITASLNARHSAGPTAYVPRALGSGSCSWSRAWPKRDTSRSRSGSPMPSVSSATCAERPPGTVSSR